MTAARLVVLRHGRTAWNATGRFQGHADIPLDDLGRHQASRVAPVLAELEPTAIHSSDLARAWQTAEPLAAACGLAVTPDRRLREIDVGSWQGLTFEQMLETVDDEVRRAYLAGEDIRRSPTGETVAEVGERVATALGELGMSAEDGSTVIAVTHGLAAWAGVSRLVGFPAHSWHGLAGVHNCGWISVERHQARDCWRIAEYNRTAPQR